MQPCIWVRSCAIFVKGNFSISRLEWVSSSRPILRKAGDGACHSENILENIEFSHVSIEAVVNAEITYVNATDLPQALTALQTALTQIHTDAMRWHREVPECVQTISMQSRPIREDTLATCKMRIFGGPTTRKAKTRREPPIFPQNIVS
jgi:hypothetical protein